MIQSTDQSTSSYEILEEIGRSEAAILYRARSKDGAHPLLLLVFRVALPEEEFITGVRWNARSLAPLPGDEVARVTAWGVQSGGQLYLAVEDVPGLTLAAHMADWAVGAAPPSAAEALELVARLARILHRALRVGIVHKDLQPGFVVLRADGAPTLIGLELPPLPAGDADAGRNRYHSPEQRAGHALDGRSNIYSLGLILYDLLTSSAYVVTPPADLPPLGVVRPQLAPETIQVVQKCLEPASWARYQTYPELFEALNGALAAEGATAPVVAAAGPPTVAAAARPPRPTSRRGPLAYLLPALLLLALVAGLIGILLGSGVLGADRGLNAGASQPTATGTPSPTPAQTATEGAARSGAAGALTLSPTPSRTPSATPTRPPSPRATATTATPSPTRTLAPPSATPTATSTGTSAPPPPTSTPLPPTETPTPSPTNTSPPPPPPPPANTATATAAPTDTPAAPTDTPAAPTATPPLPGVTPTATPPAPGHTDAQGGAPWLALMISLPVLSKLLKRKEP